MSAKLYRTTFDKALATYCLDCQFSGSQKAPEEEPRVLPVSGKMATEAGAQPSQAGRHPLPHSAPAPPAQSSQEARGGEGRRGWAGRAGRRLPAGKPGAVGGARGLLGAPSRSFVAQPCPSCPARSPRLLRGGSAAAPLSIHSGFLGLRAERRGFLNLLKSFLSPAPTPFRFPCTFFLNIVLSAKSNHWVY